MCFLKNITHIYKGINVSLIILQIYLSFYLQKNVFLFEINNTLREDVKKTKKNCT